MKLVHESSACDRSFEDALYFNIVEKNIDGA